MFTLSPTLLPLFERSSIDLIKQLNKILSACKVDKRFHKLESLSWIRRGTLAHTLILPVRINCFPVAKEAAVTLNCPCHIP